MADDTMRPIAGEEERERLAENGRGGTSVRWPRLLRPHNTHYLIHKVAAAWVDDSQIIRFRFQHDDLTEYVGPGWHGLPNGAAPLPEDMLRKHDLDDVNNIKYVVAYHCGADPAGWPVVLFSDLDNLEAKCSKIL